jgi:hypothetical protein
MAASISLPGASCPRAPFREIRGLPSRRLGSQTHSYPLLLQREQGSVDLMGPLEAPVAFAAAATRLSGKVAGGVPSHFCRTLRHEEHASVERLVPCTGLGD